MIPVAMERSAFPSKAFLESLLYEAQPYGHCTIFLERGEERVLTYQEQAMQQHCEQKYGCNMQFDTGTSQNYSAVAGLSQQAIKQCLQAAKRKAQETSPSEFAGLQPLLRYGAAPCKSFTMSIGEISEMMHQVLATHPLVTTEHVSTSVLYREKVQQVSIATSQGKWITEQRFWGSFSVEARETVGSARLWTEQSTGWTTSSPLMYRAMLVSLLDAVEKSVGNTKAAQAAPKGLFPVIFAPGIGGVFIHEICGHLLEGSFVAIHHSPFCEKISLRIASELLNVLDDPSLPDGFGTHHIDDEGQPTFPVPLICNGVLTAFLTNRSTGYRLGVPSTASSRREDFRYPATPRMSNTYVAPGSTTCDLSTMIANLPQGLFARRLGRGKVDHQTGQFAIEVREGMWIHHGRPAYAIKPLWIVGEASQALLQIAAVGNDLALASVICKSISGSLPVGVGLPSLLVNHLYLTDFVDFSL